MERSYNTFIRTDAETGDIIIERQLDVTREQKENE